MTPAQSRRMQAIHKSVVGLKNKMVDEISNLDGTKQSQFTSQIQLDDALFGLNYAEKAICRLLELAEASRSEKLTGKSDA